MASGVSALTTARSRLPRALFVGLAAVVALGAGLAWIFASRDEVSTDDAYVQAPRIVVSPKVSGMVEAVTAEENRPVRAGDVLVRLDPAEYDLKLRQAEGDLMAARASEAAARAGLGRLDAEDQVARSRVAAAAAQAGAKGGADPGLRAAFLTARDEGLAAARTHGEIAAALAEARAAAFRAETELEADRALRADTAVAAPAPGVGADIRAAVGAMVEPGVTLMTIIGADRPTITADFKESQIGRIRPGAPAVARIDALPGLAFRGRVESLAPGTGAEFALIPFEPGTGAFTKIVQRVPVRIVLDPGQAGLERLRAGLSAEVTVRPGDR